MSLPFAWHFLSIFNLALWLKWFYTAIIHKGSFSFWADFIFYGVSVSSCSYCCMCLDDLNYWVVISCPYPFYFIKFLSWCIYVIFMLGEKAIYPLGSFLPNTEMCPLFLPCRMDPTSPVQGGSPPSSYLAVRVSWLRSAGRAKSNCSF